MSNTGEIGLMFLIAIAVGIIGISLGIDIGQIDERSRIILDRANKLIKECEADIARTQYCTLAARPKAEQFINYGKSTNHEQTTRNKNHETANQSPEKCTGDKKSATDS